MTTRTGAGTVWSRLSEKPNLLEDGDRHVEVVVLHGGGGVDGGERRAHVDHELVVEPPVVEVVADGAHEHGQALERGSEWRRVSLRTSVRDYTPNQQRALACV